MADMKKNRWLQICLIYKCTGVNELCSNFVSRIQKHAIALWIVWKQMAVLSRKVRFAFTSDEGHLKTARHILHITTWNIAIPPAFALQSHPVALIHLASFFYFKQNRIVSKKDACSSPERIHRPMFNHCNSTIPQKMNEKMTCIARTAFESAMQHMQNTQVISISVYGSAHLSISNHSRRKAPSCSSFLPRRHPTRLAYLRGAEIPPMMVIFHQQFSRTRMYLNP